MTDRKVTCVACKETVTLGTEQTISGDKTFSGEVKATGQPDYAPDNDTDLVATIGTLDGYTPMVRTSGEQTIGGIKEFISRVDLRTGFNSQATTSEGATIMKITDRLNKTVQEYGMGISRNVNEGNEVSRQFLQTIYRGEDLARLTLDLLADGTARLVLYKSIGGVTSAITVATL